MLHQGTTQHPQSRYQRILFVPRGGTGLMHNNVINDALNLDIPTFCLDVVEAARAWRVSVKGSEPYEGNVGKFVQLYPDGLPPYIVGAPVIS